MPTTRSSTRLSSNQNPVEAEERQSTKRKPDSLIPITNANKKLKRGDETVAHNSELDSSSRNLNVPAASPTVAKSSGESFVPAVLTFDFDQAKQNLIEVDPRFEDLFNKMPCRPFEHLEQVHPFRALATSILGQQISWIAARSITHKFIRLYNPSLPEKHDEETKTATMALFPTPEQVASTDITVLRTAGLSARKAEYIQDLAARFADGRLSTHKLISATDEELSQMLIQVRGIGQWTVDMFAIFSLRRPDILPVGDLGVQRGLVRWFLALHSSSHSFSISPEKVGGASSRKHKGADQSLKEQDTFPTIVDTADTLKGGATSVIEEGNRGIMDAAAKASDSPSVKSTDGARALPLPVPFTPSIQRTLDRQPERPTPLPAGINSAVLKARLDGKKIKGAFLTPQEMTDLTESWRPFRSLGVYYMWSLAKAQDE